MVNKQLYDYFHNAYSQRSQINGPRGWLMQTDPDSHLFPQSWENMQLRTNYQIPVEEEIIYKRDTSFWSSHNQGIVVTDVSIYVHSDNEQPSDFFYFDWSIVASVSYKDEVFYFYDSSNELLATLGAGMFFKGSFNDIQKTRLASFLTQAAALVSQPENACDKILNLEDNEKYDDALQALSELSADELKDPWVNLVYGRVATRKLMTLDGPDENLFNLIKDKLNKALELVNDEGRQRMYWYASYWQGYNAFLNGQHYIARNHFIDSLETDGEDMKKDAMQMLDLCEDNLKEIWDNYLTTYQYNERKYVMPVRDYQIAGCTATGIDIFRLSNIPSCMRFPLGHPVANELYIGHPYKPELYVPYKGHEDVFFIDKIHELSYILQCLGAEEISITAVKGKTVNEIEKTSSSLGGNADLVIFEASGQVNSNDEHLQSSQSNVERTLIQKFDPLKKPYVPEGLIWYPEQPKWQRLVESRLNGNMLEYSEYVSTFDTSFTSSSEADDIKASVQYLWNKLDANASSKVEKEFEQKIETQWRIDVKFRSILDFDKSTLKKEKSLSTNEQSYLETLVDCYSGGEISEREQHMIERMRVSMGISEQRAAELKAMIQAPQMTEDEQEYLDMYREYAEKGEVTDKERNRLCKYASALGITADRAAELERQA